MVMPICPTLPPFTLVLLWPHSLFYSKKKKIGLHLYVYFSFVLNGVSHHHKEQIKELSWKVKA